MNTIVGAMVINEGEDQACCKVHKIPIRKVSSDYYVSVFTIWGPVVVLLLLFIVLLVG